MKDRMQQSRFELKYHLNEEKARQIRDFVQHHILASPAWRFDLDEFSVGKPNFSYAVHSLYLDSDGLETYWDTINGDKNRFKLRIRYYDSNPGSPVFFEIKRRQDHCILKQRGGVKKEMVPWLLGGHHPEPGHLLSKSPRQMVALQRFCTLMQQIHASPKVHIAYQREAYVSEDDSFRLTLDREICSEANLDGVIQTRMRSPAPVYQGRVILELKFTNRFPNWYRDLVETFNLMQCGAAKYVEGVQAVGHRALGSPVPVVEDAAPRLRPVNGQEFHGHAFRKRAIPGWVDDVN
jgi:hypothetical protein